MFLSLLGFEKQASGCVCCAPHPAATLIAITVTNGKTFFFFTFLPPESVDRSGVLADLPIAFSGGVLYH